VGSLRTLLDAEYVVEGDKPVIQLFYKGEGGRFVERVGDFEPYFYVVPAADAKRIEKEVAAMPGVTGVVEEEKIYGAGKVKVLKVRTRLPRDVGVLRDDVKKLDGVREVLEADIPFTRRYLIDSGLTPMADAEKVGLNVAAVDIEVYNPGGEPKPERDPVIMVSYADSSGLSRVYTTKKISLPFVETVADERALIKKLVDVVSERGVDIIVGYNSDNFDFPYLKTRAEKHRMPLPLGIDGSDVKLERRGMNMGASITGRPHVDLYLPCRQTYNFPRYRLEDVYEGIFGRRKKDIETRKMAEIWDSNDPKKLSDLAEYSLSDAVSTLEIAGVILPLQYELAKIIRQPVYESSRMSSGQRVEILLMLKAFESGILSPNRPGGEELDDREGESFEGAYVVDPKKGIHDNIVLFDFRSLYPSIIISHNVDPATMDCGCCSKGEAHAAPNGHSFCTKKRGFIPGVLEWLISKRIEVKGRMKAEKDEGVRRTLNVQQQAFKLLANSMYGYYAFVRARWFCRECAEAITGWGRDYIHKTMKAAEADGFDVIYGDTDSIFITRPDSSNRDDIVSDAKAFAKKINESLPEAMELEFEGYYPRGVFITKKRYAMIGEDGKLTVKGLETRRRDWAQIAKSTQEAVLNFILRERDPKKAADYVMKVMEDIKAGRVSLQDLAINTQMTRGFGEYVQPGPHIAAAKKAMKEGMEFREGSIITYIVTKNGDSITDRARVIDFVKEGEYDPQYYIDNQLLPAVTRILEALGYTTDELKGFGRQSSLGDW
jgi:DNA polymerase I